MTTPAEAKEIIRRWNEEGWSGGKYELAHEIISPNMIVGAAKKVHGVVNLPLELTYLTEKSWKEK